MVVATVIVTDGGDGGGTGGGNGERNVPHEDEHQSPDAEPRICQHGGEGLVHGLMQHQHLKLSLHLDARHVRSPVGRSDLPAKEYRLIYHQTLMSHTIKQDL